MSLYITTPLGVRKVVGKCPHPHTFRRDGILITVPCGKCPFCLSSRRAIWNFRLNLEYYKAYATFFITLTYSDDNLINYFVKSYIQNFIKRLRSMLVRGWKCSLKYYLTSEYGSKTLRPHHHALLFIYSDSSDQINYLEFADWCNEWLQLNWKRGFVSVSEVQSARINYITHYHTRPKFPKPLSKKTSKKPFVLSSQGLGSSAFDDIVYIRGMPLVYDYFNGHYIILPSYYRRKLGIRLDTDDIAPSKYINTDSDLDTFRRLESKFNINYNTESL